MITYTFSVANPQQQYIQLEVCFPTSGINQLRLQLPTWRPGRYELGNFAKNVKGLKVFDTNKKRCQVRKENASTWLVEGIDSASITVHYSYYAAELNAGSTYLDSEQLYVNPVNCCMYADGMEDMNCHVQLNVSEQWKIAVGLSVKDRSFTTTNFDQLADTPFICSPHLHHQSYECHGIDFHVWINGNIQPDWERLVNDFSLFTERQLKAFGEFPADEFHFLIHILPYSAYHGVEHLTSTVITLGPSPQVFKRLYKELLGVSSHELYHVWNIKSLRPTDMLPYDFSKANFSELGYIYEGVTTYLGDLYLLKSGVFSIDQYLDEMQTQLQKHFDNHGRFHYSVAESSFDTWLDGYVPGAPGRKVSIYTEGCLIAFVLDTMIGKATHYKFGIEELMKRLYFTYGGTQHGYTETNVLEQLKNITGQDFTAFFKSYVHGNASFEPILTEAFEAIGLELVCEPAVSYSESTLGCKLQRSNGTNKVQAIFPGSPADLGGLMLGDEIFAINSMVCQSDVDAWLNHFEHVEKQVSIVRKGKLIHTVIPEVNRTFYNRYNVKELATLTHEQTKAKKLWIS
jgi:predicted metalloprotease with PDZ domain